MHEWYQVLLDLIVLALHKQGCVRVEAQLRLCSRTDKTDFVERYMGQQSQSFSQKEE